METFEGYDVDMTVEEGIQSIVTSGVATGQRSEEESTEGMLERFNRHLNAADVVDIDDLETYAVDASSQLGATARETMAAARERASGTEADPDSRSDDTEERGGG